MKGTKTKTKMGKTQVKILKRLYRKEPNRHFVSTDQLRPKNNKTRPYSSLNKLLKKKLIVKDPWGESGRGEGELGRLMRSYAISKKGKVLVEKKFPKFAKNKKGK